MKSLLGKLLQKNLLYLLALSLSLVLWLYVLNTQVVQMERSMPLLYLLPQGEGIKSEIQAEAQVFLEGPRSFLSSLKNEDLSLKIDVSRGKKVGENTYVVDLKKGELPLPFGVSVSRVFPDKLALVLEEEFTGKIPIGVKFAGNIGENRELVRTRLDQKTIEVTGAKSLVKALQVLDTQEIDLSTLSGEGELPLKLVKKDPRLRLNKEQLKELKLHFSIKPTEANRILEGVPISFLSRFESFFASHKEVTLMLLTESKKTDQQLREMISVIGKIPMDTTRRANVTLEVDLPDGVDLLKILPSEITVDIK